MRRQGSAWLVIAPERARWNREIIQGVRIVRSGKRKPTLGKDEVAIKVTIHIPDSVFASILPEVDVVVDERQVVSPPTIEIEEQA